MARMSNWHRQHQSDEDFTRAAWDLAKDAELVGDGVVISSVRIDARRGVWRFVTALVRSPGGSGQREIARVVGEYPNSRANSLAAFLFAHMNALCLCVESAVKEEHNRAARQG